MLVLSRRIGESIIIDNNIKVTLLGLDKNQVRVGVSAPKNIPIFREEIQRRIVEENFKYEDVASHEPF